MQEQRAAGTLVCCPDALVSTDIFISQATGKVGNWILSADSFSEKCCAPLRDSLHQIDGQGDKVEEEMSRFSGFKRCNLKDQPISRGPHRISRGLCCNCVVWMNHSLYPMLLLSPSTLLFSTAFTIKASTHKYQSLSLVPRESYLLKKKQKQWLFSWFTLIHFIFLREYKHFVPSWPSLLPFNLTLTVFTLIYSLSTH